MPEPLINTKPRNHAIGRQRPEQIFVVGLILSISSVLIVISAGALSRVQSGGKRPDRFLALVRGKRPFVHMIVPPKELRRQRFQVIPAKEGKPVSSKKRLRQRGWLTLDGRSVRGGAYQNKRICRNVRYGQEAHA